MFVLDLAIPNKVMRAALSEQAMTVQGRGRPTHLVSRNKRVRVWHRRMGHASNARIIRASKLLIGMGDFNAEYDPEEVYSDSEQSASNDDVETETTQEAPELLTAFASHAIENDFDSTCTPCIASKPGL